MKILLLLFLLFSDNNRTHQPADNTIVYICDSSSAKKYHLREDCRGLRSCQHRVIKLTLEQAKKRGKTLCGWEK